MYFGFKTLFSHEEESEAEEAVEMLTQHEKSKGLLLTVALITFASCGADNIGLFTPYFITLNVTNLILTLILFLISIFCLIFLGKLLSNFPGIHEITEKYSRYVVGFIYLIIGILVLIESGTIAHFFK
ncbi:hypothetical protein Hs30E_12660 [Lactococcus hodotermopsidis]|uniref:Cadmium transporter n=1 Tax=Pseudolactococcus hodotermopsidis TaxID=2709157 RepID=A0A6A0BDH1_9LACT|nr:hypothetical protein Hs30E_12660 [Lactococcus hodotermopsidis]